MASLYNCSHAKSLGNLGIQNSRYFLRGFTYSIQSRSIWQKRLFKRNILVGLSSIETVPARGQYYLVMIPDSDLNVNIAVLCSNVSRKHTNCSYSRVTTFSHLRIHKLGRKFFVNWFKNRSWSPHSSPFLNHINILTNHSPQSPDFGFQEQTLLGFNSLVDTTITSAGWTRMPGWEILCFLQSFSLSLGNPPRWETQSGTGSMRATIVGGSDEWIILPARW